MGTRTKRLYINSLHAKNQRTTQQNTQPKHNAVETQPRDLYIIMNLGFCAQPQCIQQHLNRYFCFRLEMNQKLHLYHIMHSPRTSMQE